MRKAVLFILFFALFSQHARADNRFIVRADGGLAAIQQVCALLGCAVNRGLDGSQGQLFLVTTNNYWNANAFIQILQLLPGISNVEADTLESISRVPITTIAQGLWNSQLSLYYGSYVWDGYSQQPSAQIVNLSAARQDFNATGSGIVGVIDTGIDPNHPALSRVVVAGYDFTRDTNGSASELNDLTQPVSPRVSGVPPAFVNQSSAAVVDQDSALVLRQYAAFGHGTMVSGLVHMVAPTAMIMPLKAFRADGSGYISDIVRAIYYGVQNGANVLNMSFSTRSSSKELRRAIDQAVQNGTTCVGSAGNDGQQIIVYPAGYNNVIGVASTDYLDQRSTFSNYGQGLVWVAAPGETIISTFPFGTYGSASGTSFSTPFVSGVAALLRQVKPNHTPSQAAQAISHAKTLTPEMGNGRLDIDQAISAMTTLP